MALDNTSPTSMVTVDKRLDAMGTHAHLVVSTEVGRAGLALELIEQAADRINDLEHRWSRFIPHSEVSRWNAGGTEPVRPTDATWRLVQTSARASEKTGGRFDPTMLDTLCALGYDATFESITNPTVTMTGPAPDAGIGQRMSIDPGDRTISLAAGVSFDPGGIGKGLAGDIVTDELIAAGASRVVVNIGGDLRIRNAASSPSGGAVELAIRETAYQAEPIANVRLTHGALATSTTLRRRWESPMGTVHHILDPATRMPAGSDGPADSDAPHAIIASVIAADGWWAEAAATAFIVDPELELDGCAALLVFSNGAQRTVGAFEDYCTSSPTAVRS